jgi:hypothetical protein
MTHGIPESKRYVREMFPIGFIWLWTDFGSALILVA